MSRRLPKPDDRQPLPTAHRGYPRRASRSSSSSRRRSDAAESAQFSSSAHGGPDGPGMAEGTPPSGTPSPAQDRGRGTSRDTSGRPPGNSRPSPGQAALSAQSGAPAGHAPPLAPLGPLRRTLQHAGRSTGPGRDRHPTVGRDRRAHPPAQPLGRRLHASARTSPRGSGACRGACHGRRSCDRRPRRGCRGWWRRNGRRRRRRRRLRRRAPAWPGAPRHRHPGPKAQRTPESHARGCPQRRWGGGRCRPARRERARRQARA